MKRRGEKECVEEESLAEERRRKGENRAGTSLCCSLTLCLIRVGESLGRAP